MRFSLLTLLIAMTALGGVLARVAWLKQQRDQHRREANDLIRQLPAYTPNPAQTAEQLSRDVAKGLGGHATLLPAMNISQFRGLSREEYERLNQIWVQARQHTMLAIRYDQGMYRPWEPVWDDPDTAPDSVGWFDFGSVALLSLFGVALVAACVYVPRFWMSRRSTNDAAPPTTPIFRVMTRDVVWLAIVVALACAWRMESSAAWYAQWRAKRQESRADNAEKRAHNFIEQLWEERSKNRAASAKQQSPPPAVENEVPTDPSSSMQ